MRYGYFATQNPRPAWLKSEDERRGLLAKAFVLALSDMSPVSYDACRSSSLGTVSDYLPIPVALEVARSWARRDQRSEFSEETRSALGRHVRELLAHVVDGWHHVHEGTAGRRALAYWMREVSKECAQELAPEFLRAAETLSVDDTDVKAQVISTARPISRKRSRSISIDAPRFGGGRAIRRRFVAV